MSVYRTPSGKWMIDIVIELPNGRTRRVRKVSPVQTKVAAASYERDVREAILAGSYGRETATVEDFADRFMREHAVPRLKPRTVALYRDLLRRYVLPALGRASVDEVDRVAVERLHRSVGAKHPTTANRVLQLVSVLFAKAEAWGLRPQNDSPTKGIDRYREQAKERFLSSAERRRLEAVLDRLATTPRGAPDYVSPGAVLVVRLLAATGARLGEIVGLSWRMFDGERLRLPDSKTGAKVIPLSPQAVALLKAARPRKVDPDDLVCQSEAGTRLGNMQRTWIAIRRRADLDDVRLHDLRHSAASAAIAAGVPLHIVGGILGHRSSRTTARYAHLADDVLARAAAAMGDELEGRPKPRPRRSARTR